MEYYSALKGNQDDINRRLLRKIKALEEANAELVERVEALENA